MNKITDVKELCRRCF